MPNIVFASNNIIHFPTGRAGTLAASFDATRVPYSIMVDSEELITSHLFPAVAGNVTWFHFRTFFSSSLNSTRGTTDFFNIYDDQGYALVRLQKSGTGTDYVPFFLARIYDPNGTTNAASAIPMVRGRINTIDIRYEKTGLGINLQVYQNSALVINLTIGSNPTNTRKPRRIALSHCYASISYSAQYYSEIIVADDDTRNARLNLLRPNSTGHYEDWIGSIGTLVDDDSTTGMSTLAPNQRHTLGLPVYTGSQIISNFVATSLTTRGNNSPTGLKHILRRSGVDYEGPTHVVDFGLNYTITDFKINPSTSLPWVAADLNAIETGFLSVA